MRSPGRILTFTLALLLLVGAAAAALRGNPSRTTAYVTDAQGRQLMLAGFNTDGGSKHNADGMPHYTEADVEREAADMATNTVRLLISWWASEPEPGRYDTAYFDRVQQRIDWYASRGYTVLLDLHQDVYSQFWSTEFNGGNGAPAWAVHTDGLPVAYNWDMWELTYLEPGAMRTWDHFWNTTGEHPELMDHYVRLTRTIAERFTGQPAVIGLDVMNEPYGGSIQGFQFDQGPLSDLYQRSLTAIREVNQDWWVCVEPQAMGVNWGSPPALRPLSDPRAEGPRVAICPHLYPLPNDLGDGYAGGSARVVDATLAVWRGNMLRLSERMGGVPIILGEFGLDTTAEGAIEYVSAATKVAEEMGAGWIYWSSDDGSWGPYEEDKTPRNLTRLLSTPRPVAIAGTGATWTSEAKRLTLTWTPKAGDRTPSVVRVPFAAFPNGPSVSGGELVRYDTALGLAEILPTAGGEGAAVTVTVTPAP